MAPVIRLRCLWLVIPLTVLVVVLYGCVIPRSTLPTTTPGTPTFPASNATIPVISRTPGSTLAKLSTSLPTAPTAVLAASSPQPTDTAPPPLPVLEGNLMNQVEGLEEDAPREGSEGFMVPDEQAMADFRRITADILSGSLSQAAELSTVYGYELLRYIDEGDQGNETYMLREIKPIQRGWGLFVIRPSACTPPAAIYLLEAPHILFDENTPRLALEAFRALRGCALLIAGAHRDANQDGSADVAHDPQTVFQSIHQALADAGGNSVLVLQFHGFATVRHPGYPAAVLGGSPVDNVNLTTLLSKITSSLEDSGISTGICNEANWDALCGETNVQAINLTRGLFIHLELDNLLRESPDLVIQSLQQVLLNH